MMLDTSPPVLYSSAPEAFAASSAENKPVLIHTTKSKTGSPHPMFTANMTLIKQHFIALQVMNHTHDMDFLQHIVGEVIVPHVYIVKNNRVLLTMPHTSTSEFEYKLTSFIQQNHPVSELAGKANSAAGNDKCLLSVRLFDGTSLKHEFTGSSTLADVRNWLNTESEVEIIHSEPMPSFAHPDAQTPTAYSFQNPSIPRITYTKEDESRALAELDLCPRSVLMLKPVFNEAAVTSLYEQNSRLWSACKATAAKFSTVLHSFFNYAVDVESDDDHGGSYKLDDAHYNPSSSVLALDTTAKSLIHFEAHEADDKKQTLPEQPHNLNEPKDRINSTNGDDHSALKHSSSKQAVSSVTKIEIIRGDKSSSSEKKVSSEDQ
ncbi:hypothetical protein PSN45_005045 [Yamadazyma tenuis]|uniref:UBX domain-containing protein n=1 Tax=Candida tenuis (strain ATCC 10573 / BCRC 21748 / CBS 615 / JCM 9827 / NBRC 10315 / NRRL Y-1498 / VKM Y-70) TaxID=590646 RepID=G3B2L1_CANTC|nr:uncharacterized protein CANTEDRAFT_113490 [Yamadazyma tenuis ATCC 10573]EGV64705.1 hypothetical protein CANTEDRAFT_113490 [Yamadazyma tenuis ATCC 10573]WEJ97492.1 hypothetical protein PSN45_005045 [Yamadazyma tenuis]